MLTIRQFRVFVSQAQDMSDKAYLCVYLDKHPIPRADAVVVSMGKESFTILVPRFDLEVLVHATKDVGASQCVCSEGAGGEEGTESLTLSFGTRRAPVTLRLFTRLVVRLFMKKESGRIGVGARLAD